ncbi:hypothetical protein LNP56_27195 [Klebsiella pneumoniae subsp. pneumoniae]|nr:hypothetical protein [Klebsiella pneumoniae subsp. pneumoniae]
MMSRSANTISPGTPWVVADDGRHVPQSMMKDPATMQAFIAGHSKAEN